MSIDFLSVSYGNVIYVIVLAVVLLLIFILPSIIRNRSAKKAASVKPPEPTTSDGEEMLETKALDEAVMTTEEKQAYHYFIDDNAPSGGCKLFAKSTSTISDEEFDRIATAKINDFGSKARALGKLGIDETQVNEIAPIRFHGFEKYSRRLNDNYAAQIGKDGRWRSTVVSVTWLFFGNEEVYIYSGKFDLLTESKREMTDEYFYKDITNFTTLVETEQTVDTRSVQSGCFKKKSTTEYDRKLTDHDMFSLTVPEDTFTCSVSGVANAKQIIDGLKQKLREKKIF